MSLVLGPNATLYFAAALLVLVASLPALASAATKVTWTMLAWVAASLGAARLVWLSFARGPVLLDEYPGRTALYAVQALSDAKEENVIVMDGASYVQNGVDATIVQDELQRLGYSVRVVRMAMGAANHFERYRMHEDVVSRLPPRARAQQRWLYVTEVQAGYDRMPLAQFGSNQDSARTLHYLTPQNAWYAARALGTSGVEEPLDGAWRWPLLRHALSNAFSAGAAKRYLPIGQMEPGGGNAARTRPQKFRFPGLGPQLESLEAPPPPLDKRPWLNDIRAKRSKRLWKRFGARLLYFGLPTTTREQLDYVRAFCEQSKEPCIAPADAQLLSRLDDKKLWRDPSHLAFQGTKIYSLWLAGRLAKLNVLQK